MKFYIATGLPRAAEAKALAEQLAGMGHAITYPWWEHGSVQADGPERIREVADLELRGVVAADVFVALLPGGRGTHTELGGALVGAIWADGGAAITGARTLIFLVGPTEDEKGQTCAFYLHPRVDERFATVGELLAWLRGKAASRG